MSESNYGPGLIFSLGGGVANGVDGGYLEGNSVDALANADATRRWGCVVIGNSNARANWIRGVYFNGAVGAGSSQALWLTGTEPAGTLVLEDLSYGEWLKADWGNYTLRGYIYDGFTSSGSDRLDGEEPVPTPEYDQIQDEEGTARLAATTEGVSQEGVALLLAGRKNSLAEATETGFLRISLPALTVTKYQAVTLMIEYSAHLFRQTVNRNLDVYSGRLIVSIARVSSDGAADNLNVTVSKSGTEVEAGNSSTASAPTFDHTTSGTDLDARDIDLRVALDHGGSGTIYRNFVWRAVLLRSLGTEAQDGVTVTEL